MLMFIPSSPFSYCWMQHRFSRWLWMNGTLENVVYNVVWLLWENIMSGDVLRFCHSWWRKKWLSSNQVLIITFNINTVKDLLNLLQGNAVSGIVFVYERNLDIFCRFFFFFFLFVAFNRVLHWTYQWWCVVKTVLSFTPCFFTASTT